MFPSFISGILEEFPESSIVFDKFHVVKLLNEAMDEIKKKERRVSFFLFWRDNVEESGIVPFKEFVKMIKAHWFGIVNYFDAKISNGVLEGINNKIQLVKRRIRGYRNTANFINMILFIAGKLKFNYPLCST